MRRYIITDLTKFSNWKIVCVGLIDMDSRECLRPYGPYPSSKWVDEVNLQPGDILSGLVVRNSESFSPHIEDSTYGRLDYAGTATSNLFRQILADSLSNSVSDGFGYNFAGEKYIPAEKNAKCSLITIKVSPSNLNIYQCKFKKSKLRVSFIDESGHSYERLSITDRGFPNYNIANSEKITVSEIQKIVSSQNEIFLRVGVGREHQPEQSKKNGYWLQVNGIYMFPEWKKIENTIPNDNLVYIEDYYDK